MALLNISSSLILFISAAGIIQAILLAVLLYFHPKSDRSVTVFLSLHIFTIGILLLTSMSQTLFIWQTIILQLPFQFLIGPFLYLYVRSFKETVTWRKAWPHFILFVFILITAIDSYSGWIKKYPDTAIAPEEVLTSPYSYSRAILRSTQMVFYYFLTRKELTSYQKTIHQLYSEISRINLTWIKWLLNGFLLIVLSVSCMIFVILLYPEKFNLTILIVTAIITPYIYGVTIKGMGQPTLWQIQGEKSKDKVEQDITAVEEIKSADKQDQLVIKGLTDQKITDVISTIILLMEKEKLFQQSELTLQALADKIGIPSYQASQIINDGLKKNFYDLVNGYRVDEAKRLLLDPQSNNYTILSVGFEAGFNSKTTFNTVFKKFTGVTPTTFRAENLHAEA